MIPDLTEQVQRAIIDICAIRAPQEAVGILLASGRVIELPNRSAEPQGSFKITRDDLMQLLLDDQVAPSELQPARVTIWHSHPSGGVGPSRTDLRNRVPDASHLVVTLTTEDPIFTWY